MLRKCGHTNGGDDMVSLWYQNSNTFHYSEVVKVTILCEMEFQNFPFDIHDQCALKMRNWLGEVNFVKLNKPQVLYEGKDTKIKSWL